MAKGPPPAPIGTVGVGYVAVEDSVDETLVVDKTTVDELFDVDVGVIVELLAEVEVFDAVVEIFWVDETSWALFTAGAPLTT